MSAVLELTEQKEKNITNGKKVYIKKAYRISAKTYDSMIEHGILTENDNVELLNGEILDKMPKGTRHTSVTRFITKFFYGSLGDKVVIQVQDPILLSDFSEPEPDIVLAKPDENNYTDRHPAPEDILLIVEVSDSTLNFDRNEKGSAYSRAGIVQYLIVNVENGTIEDYRQPAEDGFQSKSTYERGQKFNLTAFPELEIKVEDFLNDK